MNVTKQVNVEMEQVEELSPQDQLNKYVAEFESALSKAEAVAREHNLEFNLYPAYGMGGWYSSSEWHPSSMSC